MKGVLSHTTRSRQGLCLAECLISLAISATLLVAVASAFSASTQAIDINDQFVRCATACRVTSDRMLKQVRDCDAVAVTSTTVDIIHPDGTENVYTYNPKTQQIVMSVENDSTLYVLASNVTAATFAADLEADPKTQINRVVRVTLNLTVTNGSNSVSLGGSAAPRRAMVY